MANMPEIKVQKNQKQQFEAEQDRKTSIDILKETKLLSKRQALTADTLLNPPEDKRQGALNKTLTGGFESLKSASESFVSQVPILGTMAISLGKNISNAAKERKEERTALLKEQRQKELDLAKKVEGERRSLIVEAQKESLKSGEEVTEVLKRLSAQADEEQMTEQKRAIQEDKLLKQIEKGNINKLTKIQEQSEDGRAEEKKENSTISKGLNRITTLGTVVKNWVVKVGTPFVKFGKKIFGGMLTVMKSIAGGIVKLVANSAKALMVGIARFAVLIAPVIAIAGIIGTGIALFQKFIDWVRSDAIMSGIIVKIEEIKGIVANITNGFSDIGTKVGRFFEDLGLNIKESLLTAISKIPFVGDSLDGSIKEVQDKKLSLVESRGEEDKAKAALRKEAEAKRKAIIDMNTPRESSSNTVANSVKNTTNNIQASSRSARRQNESPKTNGSFVTA